jgi:hypothetical protein
MNLPAANTPASFLRRLAATLMCLSGAAQVAALWLRDLTGAGVADAIVGCVYLFIGIGLFGQSRLSLFLGIVIPAVAIGLIHHGGPAPVHPYRLHAAIDAMVILLCALELWRVRHNRERQGGGP